MTDSTLRNFVDVLRPGARDNHIWPGGMAFDVASYLTSRLPPAEFVSSARAVVVRDGEVMVVEDPNELHIWPSGRIESDETWEQAMRREVAEETGWKTGRAAYLGFLHYHHLQPKPEAYSYLYPDFLCLNGPLVPRRVDTVR